MKVHIFLTFVVACFAQKIVIKTEELTSTETSNIYTLNLKDSNFTDENDTGTTTEFFNETTTTISFLNETIPTKITHIKKQGSTDLEFCTCDLQPKVCDLNCCCDRDCSSDDKDVFAHCEIEPIYYDTRYCDYIKFIYINNTRFQWEINQNGLFCVVKSNSPPSYILQRKQPIKSFAESEYEKNYKFSWPKHNEYYITFNSSRKFIFGSPIWYVNKKGLHKFDILNNFITNRCLIKENVLYLKNLHTSCSQVNLNEGNAQLHLEYYVDNIKFVSIPQLVNLTKYKDGLFEGCPKNICLPINPKLCIKSFSNCTDILRTDSRMNLKCQLSIRDKRNTCLNVVKKLQYNFYHNGTKGLTNITILAILDDISYEFGKEEPEMIQEFFVNFFWRNTTVEVSLSGNPGYLIGKPILTGTLLNIINKTDTTFKIQRNSSEYFENFLVIPNNINGDCVFTPTEYLGIEFGYNILTSCKFRKTVYIHKKVINGTEICRTLQISMLKFWNTDYNKMIGSFGNANVKNLDDWQKILYKNSPQNILNNTFGVFYFKNSSVACTNLLRTLQIDVFHSRVDLNSLVNQQKILGVTFSFNGFKNHSLPFNKTGKSLDFSTFLETQVTFYDLTRKKEKKVVDPPSLEIKLPYDFFYPFVRINNSSLRITTNSSFIIFFVLLMYLK